MKITLPTGRGIDASEFQWMQGSVSPIRDFAVTYGGFDFADYLSPSQLKVIPSYDANAVALWFYRMHKNVTLETEPLPDDAEWSLSNAADFWEFQLGEMMLEADKVLLKASQFSNDIVESAQSFKDTILSPDFQQELKMKALTAFRKVLATIPGMDFYFKAKDISEKAGDFFKMVAILGLIAFVWNRYESESR